ncbi:MAG: hypothetical protein K9L74_06875 [Candidatus Izimaplasma sp.]|nr:hypothetical protein [Candidatus Izimaplasma bacterium]
MNKITTKKAFIKITITFVLFLVVVLPVMAGFSAINVGDVTPDTLFLLSAEHLYEIAGNISADGRSMYVLLRFTFDLIWPIVYLLFLLSTIGILTKKLRVENTENLLLIPILAFTFDLSENIFFSITFLVYPRKMDFILFLGSIFSNLKWLFILVAFGSVIVLLVKLLLRQFKNNKDR